MVSPVFDLNSKKYINDPDRIWYSGQWRTQEQIERDRERERKRWHKSPEYRERVRKRRRERYANDPEYREKERSRYKIINSDPDNRMHITAMQRRRRAAARGEEVEWELPLAKTAKMLRIEREQRLLLNSGGTNDDSKNVPK